MRVFEGRRCFLGTEGYGWKERERERDIKGKRGDRLQQGDELLVKWLLFSSRASHSFSGSGFSFPQSDVKHQPGSVCKQFWAQSEVIGPFTECQVSWQPQETFIASCAATPSS